MRLHQVVALGWVLTRPSGPKLLWLIGVAVGIVANIGSGFCNSPVPFDICRAVAGMGVSLSCESIIR